MCYGRAWLHKVLDFDVSAFETKRDPAADTGAVRPEN